MTEYLRMSGIYWGLTAMALMNELDKMDRDEVIEFVKSCQHECGGFSAAVDHDPHLLYTLSAIQVCLNIVLSTGSLTITPTHPYPHSSNFPQLGRYYHIIYNQGNSQYF